MLVFENVRNCTTLDLCSKSGFNNYQLPFMKVKTVAGIGTAVGAEVIQRKWCSILDLTQGKNRSSRMDLGHTPHTSPRPTNVSFPTLCVL